MFGILLSVLTCGSFGASILRTTMAWKRATCILQYQQMRMYTTVRICSRLCHYEPESNCSS